MVVFVTFSLLCVVTLLNPDRRRRLCKRSAWDWVIDLTGLTMQGTVVPFLQIALLYSLLNHSFQAWNGAVSVPSWVAFLLNVVVVDYLYYLNHRALHSKYLWAAHSVHHTAENLDLLVTSRNTMWTPFLLVYLWVNGLFVFLLANPTGFVVGAAVSACLDIWKHTEIRLPDNLHRLIYKLILTPHEHAWHHSNNQIDCNFGANLSIWDWLHGTFYSPNDLPEKLGIKVDLPGWKKFLLPIGGTSAGRN